MIKFRAAVGIALSSTVLAGGAALAVPKAAANEALFFLRQEGCGTSAQEGRLEPKAGADGATGCGTIGGLPFDEIVHIVDGSTPDTYSTVGKGLPIRLNAAKKVKGQLAAESWYGAGGIGTITFDVGLVGQTVEGKSVDFGSTTVSAPASPSANVVAVPFELAVPAPGSGARMKSFTLSVVQRGLNQGMSSKYLDGESYVIFPTK